jgi:hypothetical protein
MAERQYKIESMSTTKYMLLKYIADLHRFEPRNIGVVVYCQDGAEARFVGEFADRLGEVDGRSIPSFVTSASAYKQWVRYWRDVFIAGHVMEPASGRIVDVTSPDFAEALMNTSRGNFVVVVAGSVLDEVSVEELPAVADQLYAQLVDAKVLDEARDDDLDAVADRLLDQMNLRSHPNFHRNYLVRCPVNGVQEEYVFSDALANGSPQWLYQRLPIPRSKVRLRKNVHDTAWSFEQIFKQNIVAPERTGVLVCVNEEQRLQADVDRSLRLLGSMTRVINLAEGDEGRKEFEALARVT